MSQALKYANQAYESDEVPIAALIVDPIKDKVIAHAINKMEQLSNPLAHAEMNVINLVINQTKLARLEDFDIYVTLEPCPMCAAAISLCRFRRLYFAAYDKKGGGVEHGPKIFTSSSCFHKPEIYGGIMEEESSLLLKKFFLNKR